MTPLRGLVERETALKHRGRPVVVMLSPAGSASDAFLGLRLKGERTQYVVRVSDVYRIAALWHGQAESAARRAARKSGVPWKIARGEFVRGRNIRRASR